MDTFVPSYPAEAPESLSSGDWIPRLQEVVDNRLHEFDLKAEDIAHDLGLSRTQFFRLMRNKLGLTPYQFLDDARFERAMYLLQSGQTDSVKATSYEVGFQSVKYFSRLFRERFGRPPSEYLAGY
jgi:AraC-like DNA-binding protein